MGSIVIIASPLWYSDGIGHSSVSGSLPVGM